MTTSCYDVTYFWVSACAQYICTYVVAKAVSCWSWYLCHWGCYWRNIFQSHCSCCRLFWLQRVLFLSSLFSTCSALCTCSYTYLYLPSLKTVQNYWSDVSVPIQSGEEQHGHALEKTLHCNGHTNSSYVAIDKLYKKHSFMYILTKE